MEKIKEKLKTIFSKKKNVLLLVLSILLVIVAVCVISTRFTSNTEIEEEPTEQEEVTNETIDWESYTTSWQENYAINSDYVGEIVFASGLINESVVQYLDLDNLDQGYYEYLRTNWKTLEYDIEGSIFVDPYSDLDSSTNIVIYGHYVYESYDASRTHMFTPLELLLDEENYADNNIFYLCLEDEIRVYEIAHVYLAQLYSSNGVDYDIVADGMEYMFSEWTESALGYYLSQVSAIEQYDTGVEISYGDKFVTLQTCVNNRDDQREIVIAKEIAVVEVGEETDLLIDF